VLFLIVVTTLNVLDPRSAISWDGEFNIHTEEQVFSPVIDLTLNCACFVYIGAWFPFGSFNSPALGIAPWRLVTLYLATLLLRRIPAIFILYRWVPEIETRKEAFFCGHFGDSTHTPQRSLSLLTSCDRFCELIHLLFLTMSRADGCWCHFPSLHRLPVPHDPPKNEEELLSASLELIVAFVVLGSIFIRKHDYFFMNNKDH